MGSVGEKNNGGGKTVKNIDSGLKERNYRVELSRIGYIISENVRAIKYDRGN